MLKKLLLMISLPLFLCKKQIQAPAPEAVAEEVQLLLHNFFYNLPLWAEQIRQQNGEPSANVLKAQIINIMRNMPSILEGLQGAITNQEKTLSATTTSTPEDCPICFTVQENFVTWPCHNSHKTCSNCYDKLCRQNKHICPFCRQNPY
jgi:hypothetical protein